MEGVPLGEAQNADAVFGLLFVERVAGCGEIGGVK